MWQKAHVWVLEVYRCAGRFPADETYALKSQLRRAAASVPTNMAEGYRRGTARDKLRFYNFAQASLDEADYHLLLAHDLGYADTTDLQAAADELARMLAAYIARVRASV